MPTITSLVTNVLSTSSVSLTWDGSYSLVNIVASTDSLFADVFYSVDSLDASTKTITGMTAGTNYYVKITPHGTGFVGPKHDSHGGYYPATNGVFGVKLRQFVGVGWLGRVVFERNVDMEHDQFVFGER
jgi:hypothetical protein